MLCAAADHTSRGGTTTTAVESTNGEMEVKGAGSKRNAVFPRVTYDGPLWLRVLVGAYSSTREKT